MTIKVTFTNSAAETIGTLELSSDMSSSLCLSTVEGVCHQFREEFNSISCDPLNFTITYQNLDI